MVSSKKLHHLLRNRARPQQSARRYRPFETSFSKSSLHLRKRPALDCLLGLRLVFAFQLSELGGQPVIRALRCYRLLRSRKTADRAPEMAVTMQRVDEI